MSSAFVAIDCDTAIGASAMRSAIGCRCDGRSVDFTRDVRPILADNCFHCHGPDAGERQADCGLMFGRMRARCTARKPSSRGQAGRERADRPHHERRSGRPHAAGRLGQNAHARTNRNAAAMGRARRRVQAALGVCRAAAAGRAGGEKCRLGPQSDRRLRARAIGKRRTGAVAACQWQHAAAATFARSDRPAADAR